MKLFSHYRQLEQMARNVGSVRRKLPTAHMPAYSSQFNLL